MLLFELLCSSFALERFIRLGDNLFSNFCFVVDGGGGGSERGDTISGSNSRFSPGN